MPHVATLVAEDLTDELCAAARAALTDLGTHGVTRDWLATGRACDLVFDHPDPTAAARALREAVAGHAVDLAVQECAGRCKKLLVADMESTIIRNEMLEELAGFAGVRPQVEEITARAMHGEIDFESAVRERVALLADLPVTVLEQVIERIDVDPGARPLVRTLRRHGVTTALVSGGFGVFAERVADALGFDRQYSNELLLDGGRLTGGLEGPLLHREAKLAILERLCAEFGLDAAEVAAVGDGANDLPMLLGAGLGIAYHGKRAVAERAAFRVDHGDLTTLLYFMGYRHHEIDGGD